MPPRTRNPSLANGSPLSPPGEGPKPGQTSPLASAQRFQRPPPEDPVAAKVQSLSAEARIFLTYDFESRYVDPQLKLPANDCFTKRPRTVPINRLKSESMEDLLLALRYLAPRVFVRSLAMNKSCLMDLYIKFVHNKTPDSPLILGYHYTLLDLSPSDLVGESMEEDSVGEAKCLIYVKTPKKSCLRCIIIREIDLFLIAVHQCLRDNIKPNKPIELLPKSPRTPGHSNESLINLALDNLLSPLRQLRITSSPSTPRNDQHLDDELTHGRSSIHHSSRPDDEISNQVAEIESPNLPATDSLPKSQSKSTKKCSEAALAKSSGQSVFDCDRFHGSDLKSANPLILHTALTASILDIFGQSSNSITKWILDIQTITIKLSTTHGILPTKSPIRQILPEEAATLKKIPSSATTTFRWLKLDPVLKYLNCCSSCFAMYPENSAPSRCHHRIANIPGGPSDSVDPNKNTCSPPSEDNEPEFSDSICGEPLFKYYCRASEARCGAFRTFTRLAQSTRTRF
ncbi:uncharacterized protein MELLADRAFT_103382 [Melampsora larici-populina 98AG31]|uniref:Uncharacterized protein n=1 Tax=Melampsora larici-populina (strain 98AG31 / pathotype 3-4-7) TaxID=747676 RepID=F4RBA2_MELLP|nr:uncharacterized protein MELLADRAFT_103382 [Melampsora larici-populina 98AG31]EGG10394.1 hypothetical protein MELLADRAFT_103382 [Melampsora larici-populina 98AG31]